jgi:hypothetical protein
MRQVIEVFKCERHPGELAYEKTMGFKFYWPGRGTFEGDPCKECADELEQLLAPFMMRRGERGNTVGADADTVRAELPDISGPLFRVPSDARVPRGAEWAATGTLRRGDVKNHVTYDRERSLCGYIRPDTIPKFVGARVEGAPYCRKCVKKLQAMEARRVAERTSRKRPTEPQEAPPNAS